jgi:hypothetical protein
MQDQALQLPVQPFIKLAQANMELLAGFSTSPEVLSQSAGIAKSLFQQSQQAATSLMHSTAFRQLSQGLLQNYTEFVTEWGQLSLTAMAQAPALLIAKAQEAASRVDIAEARGRRSRRS